MMYLKIDQHGVVDLTPGQGARPKRDRLAPPGHRHGSPVPFDDPDQRRLPFPADREKIRPGVPHQFRPRPVPGRSPVIPVLGGVGAGIGLGEWIDQALMPSPIAAMEYTPSGWVECFDCGTRPRSPSYAVTSGPGFVNYDPLTGWMKQAANVCFPACLSGQAPGLIADKVGWFAPFVVPAAAGALWLQDARDGSGVVRARHDRLVRRVSGPSTFTWPMPWVSIPVPGVGPFHAPSPYFGPEPLPQPPSPAPEPDFPPPFVFSPNWPPNGPAPKPAGSQPPLPGVREEKYKSKVKRVGIFLWNLTDTVSEMSEIVGGFWKALPPEIRAKANCGKGQNIGQYGSDVNACMLETLYQHWDKVDGPTAFMEIAKNVAEDMTIGAFHKWLSRMYPPGFSWQKTFGTHGLAQLEPEAYIAKRLKELFRFLGLEE